MGSIMLWLGRGLYLGGGALIGVLFEKISGWVEGFMPATVKTRDSSGGYAIWFVAAIVIASGAALYLLVKMIVGKKKILSLALLAMCAAFDIIFLGGGAEVIAASLLFSIAASATDTKPVAYCPEYIMFTIGTVPTSIKIESLGEGVVFDLNSTGITNLNGIRLVGELPANTYVFHIADGFIRKNTNFTFVNAHAGQLDVYGFSDSFGENFVIHESAKAFANQDNEIPSFIYAAFPSAAATDLFTVTWMNPRTRKTTNNTMTRMELEIYLAQSQEVVATRYNIDNFAQRIVNVQLRPSADQNYYFTRPQAVR